MMGKSGKRVLVGALALLLATTGLVPGGTRPAQALTDADRIETIDTSTSTGSWAPNAPGPSGIAYRADTNTLIVVDGDKNNEPGNPTTNLWEYSLTTKSVVYSASLTITGDATGVSWDADGERLFVASDSAGGVYVFEPNGSERFGGASTAFIDVDALVPPPIPPALGPDVEDPAYDATTGHLFVLSGNQSLIYEIDPFDGTFGDINDFLVTPTGVPVPPDPAIAPDHPTDWEGLALDGDDLLVGTKESDDDVNGHFIYVMNKASGEFVDRLDVGVIETELPQPTNPPLVISGLTVQPAGSAESKTYWIADRGEFSPAATNDGRLHRIHPGIVIVPDADPVLTPIGPKSGPELTQITFDADATDSFGDTLTFSLQPGFPTGAAINPTTGVFSWTPTEAQGRGLPAYSVTVRVTDAQMNFDEQIVTITANEVNQAPTVNNIDSILLAEGESVSIQMIGSDADLPMQGRTWGAAGLPTGLQINATSGLITGTIGIGTAASSPWNVTVTLTDNGTPPLQGTDAFVFNVTNTNRSPVLNAIGNKTVSQGSQLAFKANATDPDGDGLTFSLVSPPSGAAITSSGNFTWTPTVAPGSYPVTVRVTDNGTPVLTDQETITVTVQASDDENPFIDDDGHIFENAIEWLDANGVTAGCNPPTNNRFCPNDNVTRGQMATFLVRALHYTEIADDYFIDDNGNIFENAINRLRTAGVTQGCNPPTNNRFCPNDFVTRGQMAAFLVRALDLPAYNGPDRFRDDNGHVFEGAIERLAQAGITLGCNPPTNDRFCPNDNVTRGQMAAFLKRALES